MAEKSARVQQMHLPDFQLVSLGVENNFAEQSTQLLMKSSGPKKEKSRRLSLSDHGKGIAEFVRSEKERIIRILVPKKNHPLEHFCCQTFMAVVALNLAAVCQIYFQLNAVSLKGSKGI